MNDLAIKLNNAATNDPCAICRQRTDPEVGPDLFLADSYALVCYDCGWKYAPELMAMLESYRAYERARFERHEYTLTEEAVAFYNQEFQDEDINKGSTPDSPPA